MNGIYHENLNFQKIECRAKKFSSTEKKDEKKENKIDFKNVSCTKKKQTKIINKILKKLDLLGMKIRELEEAEVDLSDEEESSYIQLQRFVSFNFNRK